MGFNYDNCGSGNVVSDTFSGLLENLPPPSGKLSSLTLLHQHLSSFLTRNVDTPLFEMTVIIADYTWLSIVLILELKRY